MLVFSSLILSAIVVRSHALLSFSDQHTKSVALGQSAVESASFAQSAAGGELFEAISQIRRKNTVHSSNDTGVLYSTSSSEQLQSADASSSQHEATAYRHADAHARDAKAFVYMLYGKHPDGINMDDHIYHCCFDLLTSIYSLRNTGTKKRIILLATDSRVQSVQVLRNFGVEVRIVSTLAGPPVCKEAFAKNGRSRLLLSWTKGNIFNLTDLNIGVYLDGDTIFRKPIDFLLDDNMDATIVASFPGNGPCPGSDLEVPLASCQSKFNTGIFTFRPSADLFERYVELTASETSCPMDGSQGTENRLFASLRENSACTCLSPLVNCRPDVIDVTFWGKIFHFFAYLAGFAKGSEPCVASAYVLHWSGQSKPWSHWWDEKRDAPRQDLSNVLKSTVLSWQHEYHDMLNSEQVHRVRVKQKSLGSTVLQEEYKSKVEFDGNSHRYEYEGDSLPDEDVI